MHEASGYKSPREADSIQHTWKYINRTIDGVNTNVQNINQLNRDLQKLAERDKLDFELYPFKIYVVPTLFRSGGDVTQFTNNWRTVRVRGGFVLNNIVSTSSYVNGCDGFQNYPYSNAYGSASIVTSSIDYTIPVTQSMYWFWIENTTGSYNLRYGANPVSSSLGNPTPWVGFPSASANYIPIGWVDSRSSASINQLVIRQFLTSDIISTGGAAVTSSYPQPFQITKLNNEDWFTAVPLSVSGSTTITGSLTRIAKSPRLRTSISAEVIDGVVISYSNYTTDNNRTANDGTNTETQVVFPRYVAVTGSVVGPVDTSVIYATQVSYTGITVSGSALTWIEFSPARLWLRRFILN